MKRFLSLTLLTLLIVGTAHQSLAITENKIIIYEASPKEQTDYQNGQYDLTQYAITADFPIDNFKIGLDGAYSGLKDKSTKVYECYAYKLKGGFALALNDRIRLDLTAGYFNGQFRPAKNFNYAKVTYDSLIAGLDAKLVLSESVWINATYACGINPQVSVADRDYELDQLSLANVRLNFQFLEDTGLSVGYRWETFKNDKSQSNYDIENKGFTIGLSYIFL